MQKDSNTATKIQCIQTKKDILLDHFLALYEGWEDDDLVKFSQGEKLIY